MYKVFSIFIICFLVQKVSAKSILFLSEKRIFQQTKDTAIVDIKKEDEVIKEVIESKTLPKKEKIKYVSQVTRYGFKNLFSNYSYNAAVPYTAQINPNAESFMQDYIKAHSNNLIKMKSWGMPYFNLIENVLQQYGLPKELKYIAVIESNLQTNALSPKGACGPWQLMPATAKTMGLTINNNIDERTDYNKSTQAASKFLLDLYGHLHDWLLVMAAYNCGLGRVNSAIKKSGSTDFWTLQFYLPEESRTYVKRFIATQYIMDGTNGNALTDSLLSVSADGPALRTNYNKNYFGNSNTLYNSKPNLTQNEFADLQVLTISGKYKSAIIAKNLAMDDAVFNRYNPYLDKIISGTGNFDLRLPADKMELFQVKKYPILNECVQNLLGSACMPASKTYYRTPIQSSSKRKKHHGY